MSEQKACTTLRLSEAEKETLKRSAALCGLSQAEFIRQLCRGIRPHPQPGKEFWELLDALYQVHGALLACIPFMPEAEQECWKIRDLVLKLQEAV